MSTPRTTTTPVTGAPARPVAGPSVGTVLARVQRVIGSAGLERADATIVRLVLRHLLFDDAPVPAWRTEAACAEIGAEVVFYPEPGDELGTAAGKRVCAGCPVRTTCLADALGWETTSTRHGIVGGLTATERAALARQRSADVGPTGGAAA